MKEHLIIGSVVFGIIAFFGGICFLGLYYESLPSPPEPSDMEKLADAVDWVGWSIFISAFIRVIFRTKEKN